MATAEQPKKEKKKINTKLDLISFRPLQKAKIPKSKDIVKEYISDDKKVKDIYDQVTGIIDGKEKEKKSIEEILKRRNRENLRKDGYNINIDEHVSKTCKPLIEQMQINFQEISKKNAELLTEGCGINSEFTNYLNKYKAIDKNYGRVTRNKNKNNNKSLPKIKYICNTENNIASGINSDNVNFHHTKINKKINMARINDSYRMKLNKTFLKYNPYIHLSRLKQLVRVNTEEKEEIDELKEKIKNDIKEITDHHYYAKKEEKIKKYFENNQLNRPATSVQVTTQNNPKDLMNKTGSTYYKSHNSTQNNFRNKKGLSPLNKKNLRKENKDWEELKKALEKSERTMDLKKILDYIDKHTCLEAYQTSTFEDRMDSYFPEFAETFKLLEDIKDKGMRRMNEKKEKDLMKDLDSKNDDLIKLLDDVRNNLLNIVDESQKEVKDFNEKIVPK